MKKLIILLTLLSCGGRDGSTIKLTPEFYRIPDQDKADTLIWYGFFNNTVPPPPVQWIEEPDLMCVMEDGMNVGFYEPHGFLGPWTVNSLCVAGVTFFPSYLCEVAHPTEYTFSGRAWPHEMFHAALYNETGDGDPNHKNPGWLPGGLLDQARQILKENGL